MIFIGAITAFFAATVGLVQNDIKRVIAYSTCSQLGYMFVALGVGAYRRGIFHLFTHAFFKALLFLGAGSVIHADRTTSRTCATWAACSKHPDDLCDDDDRHAGADRRRHPASIGFAGFFSKDAIIEAAYRRRHTRLAAFAFMLLVIAALLHQLLFLAADLHDLPRRAAGADAEVMRPRP